MLMLEYSTILCEKGRPHRTWTTEVLSIHHQNEMKSLGGPVFLAGITNSFQTSSLNSVATLSLHPDMSHLRI